MITLFNYLLTFNIFAGGFVLFATPFEFYVGYIFIIFFLFMYILCYKNTSINSNFLLILIILTISSLANVYFGNTTIFLMTKQVLGISITGTAYYLLIKINNYEIDKLFKIYLRIALIVAIIGIFQEYCFLMEFERGYDYSWLIQKWGVVRGSPPGMLRVNSIFMEPSHFAISMAPAFFVALTNILRKNCHYFNTRWGKMGSILIIISYILTFSAVGYIAVVLSVLLIYNIKKFRQLLLVLIIIPIFAYVAYNYMWEIRARVDDTIEVVTGSMKVADSHGSVYALASNAYVAYKSFIYNFLFGRGLGSHPLSYDKFIRSGASIGFFQKNYPILNKEDAGSLFFRLVSETGLFGIGVVLYFVFKFRLKVRDNKNLQIISNAIFTLFIAQLLKQGHYFYNGLFFFVWMYYFAYKIYNEPDSKIWS